jgi:glycosyltransferase involved in cell wall biosynthesis
MFSPAGAFMSKIAVITNEPPPYRVPIFNEIAKSGIDLQVIFCAKKEPNRHWNLPPMEFDHHYLREHFITIKGRYIHHNPDVFAALKRFSPDVIVNDGFNPTNLYAFTYALLNKIPHVPMTDGTDMSEHGLSKIHKTVRRIVFKRSKAFLYASLGGLRLYQSYGVSEDNCFRTHLCIDNGAYDIPSPGVQREYDLMFCGRMEKVKSPGFALDVAYMLAKRLKRKVRILFVGSGSEEEELQTSAAQLTDFVDAHFHGFALQEELPALYRSAKIFLFPTQWDPWGVVTNEACAAGLPIIVSPFAGVNGELVVDSENGFICPLDSETWVDKAALLLQSPDTWECFSKRSLELVQGYNFQNAASGLLAACEHALSGKATTRRKYKTESGSQSI